MFAAEKLVDSRFLISRPYELDDLASEMHVPEIDATTFAAPGDLRPDKESSRIGIGEDVAGSLFLLDGLALEWRKIRLPKDRGCKACS